MVKRMYESGDHVLNYTIIEYLGKNRYECVCNECGRTAIKRTESLKRTPCPHHINICDRRIAMIFRGMKQRCYNPKHYAYKHYGGRGITICDEWLEMPRAFVEWCHENDWAPGLQIDRIDNNKGYSPSNCRIVSVKINANNKRTSINLTVGNLTMTLAQWSEYLNIPYSAITSFYKRCGKQRTINRIANGWFNYKQNRSYITDKAIEVDGILDTRKGWCRRLKRNASYVTELISRHGEKEAIRRITEQWEAIKKNEQ